MTEYLRAGDPEWGKTPPPTRSEEFVSGSGNHSLTSKIMDKMYDAKVRWDHGTFGLGNRR